MDVVVSVDVVDSVSELSVDAAFLYSSSQWVSSCSHCSSTATM